MPNVRPWSGGGNAEFWGTSNAGITDQTPTVGAVAWWRANASPAGSAGHVGYIERVVSPTEIIVSMDWWGGDFTWARIIKGGGSWPSGFIHFNDRTLTSTAAPVVSGTPRVGDHADHLRRHLHAGRRGRHLPVARRRRGHRRRHRPEPAARRPPQQGKRITRAGHRHQGPATRAPRPSRPPRPGRAGRSGSTTTAAPGHQPGSRSVASTLTTSAATSPRPERRHLPVAGERRGRSRRHRAQPDAAPGAAGQADHRQATATMPGYPTLSVVSAPTAAGRGGHCSSTAARPSDRRARPSSTGRSPRRRAAGARSPTRLLYQWTADGPGPRGRHGRPR